MIKKLIAASVVGITALGIVLHLNAQQDKMKSDLTIYVDEPLLSEGGTVIVLAQAIPANTLTRKASSNNQYSINHKFEATVSSVLSIVRLNYPEDGTFVFRFGPKPGSPNHTVEFLTHLESYGTDGYDDKIFGKTVEFKSQAIQVLGRNSSAEQTRLYDARFTEMLRDGLLNCNTLIDPNLDVQVCGLKSN